MGCVSVQDKPKKNNPSNQKRQSNDSKNGRTEVKPSKAKDPKSDKQ